MNLDRVEAKRRELAAAPELWQFQLLTHSRLRQRANDFHIRISGDSAIVQLWSLGLLRADLVQSTNSLSVQGITPLSATTYYDHRRVQHRLTGYGGALNESASVDSEITLYFHPFRIYVLYQMARVFAPLASRMQYLANPTRLSDILALEIQQLDRWTSTPAFAERFEYWNTVAEAAIVVEPASYQAIFHARTWSHPDTEETLDAKLSAYRAMSKDIFHGSTAADTQGFRESLCQAAELLDPNKLIHVLLRQMSRHERLKLKGSLGASMLFLTMAESIRRAAEAAHGQQLPEEDEMGFGQWMPGSRETVYGTTRIFDDNPGHRRDFLTTMGLDVGTKVRCYVEGDTEYGALASALASYPGVEIVNLRGRVLEKGKDCLAFVDALGADRTAQVFSMVLLDGDRHDHIRALRKAATEERFFGRFWIASPDVEFHNFTQPELAEIAHDLQSRTAQEVVPLATVQARSAHTKCGKTFFAALDDVIGDVAKGDAWGSALMTYAIRRPEFPVGDHRAGVVRPLVDAARQIIHACQSGYARSVAASKVEPSTGRLIPRPSSISQSHQRGPLSGA